MVVVVVAACGADSAEETAASTSSTSVGAADSVATTTTASTTTTVLETTTASSSTTTTPTVLSHELWIWGAPADGQWFSELPIPWVYARVPETDPPTDGVPEASGWTKEEAVVTINGHATAQEWEKDWQGGSWDWGPAPGEGDPIEWREGANAVVFEATFADGFVVTEERTIYYDPSLGRFTGWMVELDRDERALTFAAASIEAADDDGTDVGPVTSVKEYTIRDDAAFILLDPDSSGEPPASVVGFDEFVALLDKAEAGECKGADDCFFAWGSDFFVTADEPGGYPFAVYVTEDGEIQQLEQIWGP